MFLGIPRNSQPKPIVFRFSTANMRHKLIAVCKSILRGHKSIFAARGIAAKRDNIANTLCANRLQNIIDIRSGRPHTGEMTRRSQTKFVLDKRGNLQCFGASRTTCTIRNRHITGIQLEQIGYNPRLEGAHTTLRLRRINLKRNDRLITDKIV